MGKEGPINEILKYKPELEFFNVGLKHWDPNLLKVKDLRENKLNLV